MPSLDGICYTGLVFAHRWSMETDDMIRQSLAYLQSVTMCSNWVMALNISLKGVCVRRNSYGYSRLEKSIKKQSNYIFV